MTTDDVDNQTPDSPKTVKLEQVDVADSQVGAAQKKLKNARQWKWLNPQPEPPSPKLNPQPEPPIPWLNPQPEPPLPSRARFGQSIMLLLMGIGFALVIGCGAVFAMGPGRPILETTALSLGIDVNSLLPGGGQGGTPAPGDGSDDGSCFDPCTPSVTKCIGVLTCQTRDDGSSICYDDQFCSCHTDGKCDAGEASVCPDCKPAPCTCGDGQCQADCQESAQSCPADCSGPTQVPVEQPPVGQPPSQPTPVCSCTCTDPCLPTASCPKCVDSCTGAICAP